jgi:CheY-like chemotaxis protein
VLSQGHFALADSRSVEVARPVLVADGSRIIREMLCRLFEVEENYDICAKATNGQEAIELALKHRPELIILDFSMPVLNGLDAAKELKSLMPGVPIILFTQYSDLIFRIDAPDDRIVSKNNAAELMDHVRSLLPSEPSRSRRAGFSM